MLDWILASAAVASSRRGLRRRLDSPAPGHGSLDCAVCPASSGGASAAADREIHLLLCFADHYEPKAGRAAPERAAPASSAGSPTIRDQFAVSAIATVGRRKYFFYPIEEYEADYLDALAGLCRAGFGEVEVHLHHDNDTDDNVRAALLAFRSFWPSARPLARDRATVAPAYGFIHGNWSLNNSLPDGRCAASITNWKFCARPAATPTSRCRRPPAWPRRATINSHLSRDDTPALSQGPQPRHRRRQRHGAAGIAVAHSGAAAAGLVAAQVRRAARHREWLFASEPTAGPSRCRSGCVPRAAAAAPRLVLRQVTRPCGPTRSATILCWARRWFTSTNNWRNMPKSILIFSFITSRHGKCII